MFSKFRQQTAIILLAAVLVLAGCGAPESQSPSTLQASPTQVLKPDTNPSPTASATLTSIPTGTESPIPATGTPLAITLVPRDQFVQTTEPSYTPTPSPTPTVSPTAFTASLQNQLTLGGIYYDPTLTDAYCPPSSKPGVFKPKVPLPTLEPGKVAPARQVLQATLPALRAIPSIQPKLQLPGLQPTSHPLSIAPLGRSGELFKVCLYGFPLNTDLQVELQRPDGSLAGKAIINATVENGTGLVHQVDPEMSLAAGIVISSDSGPILQYSLWLPAGMPAGNWQIKVSSPSGQATAKFIVPKYQPPARLSTQPLASAVVSADTSPFDRPALSSSVQCQVIDPSEGIKLYGVDFPAGETFPLGVYANSSVYDYPYVLVRQKPVQVNQKGKFQFELETPIGDPPGNYYPVIVMDEQVKKLNEAGPFVCYTVVSWQPCPDASLSQLARNMNGWVAQQIPPSGKLRSAVGDQAETIENLNPGETFQILDGPTCQDGQVWWQIQTADGQQGWASEGQGNQPFLKSTP